MAVERPSRSGEGSREASPDLIEHTEVGGEARARAPAQIRNVAFPVVVRGYDRHAVDAYVQRVNRVIAELEVTGSPKAAVRHAVDRVTEQTKGILQQARDSAEQITGAAEDEADRIMAEAKAEAAELVVNASADSDRAKAEAEALLAAARTEAEEIVATAKADAEKTVAQANEQAAERRRQSDAEIAARQEEAAARLRELQAETEAVWNERARVLGDIHAMASQLEEAASAAAGRLSRQEPSAAAEDPTLQHEVVTEPSDAPPAGDSARTPG
jgi:DivIVA domain-containing protein